MSQGLPFTISYPPELPVSAARDELARAISENQVVIVAGATGSGKTTQLPKICLELGRERIGHTQPRRIAARSIAERISEELGVELGTIVGYQVRFDDRSTRDTRIKLMTDGVLLAELNRDRELRRYDTIILDEAHERSLTIDFLLGYLKQLLPRRPDLKVIVTSATIDPESFARHFADAAGTPAPIVEVSGRTYPVEIRYRPLTTVSPEVPFVSPEVSDETQQIRDARPVRSANLRRNEEDDEDADPLDGMLAALDELGREAPGDVLVFLSGENEIRDAEDAIRGRVSTGSTNGLWAGTEVLPLYGRLSAADQHRVFETKRSPGIRRRVVLATNVAETSLTVPGIKYVIDAGTARISRYSVRAKVQRLPIEAISQASANQRSGRAGRTSDGIAIRLYSEEDFEKRPAFTDPEILRTNLAAVILQMISIGLGDIAAFPFLQPPDSRGIQDGMDLLRELGAVSVDRTTGHTRITKVGRDLATLPLDPRFGRMLVEAQRNGVVREVAAIVAGLSIQDVRERPLEKRAQADQLHARFADPTSDFLGLLKLWNYLEEQQRELSSSAFRRLCKSEFLNYLRIREWQDLYRQLVRAGKPLGIVPGDAKVDADGIHKSLLAGLLSRIGLRDERVTKTNPKEKPREGREPKSREYLGARNQKFAIFPGSALARKGPPAVMAAELVETSRLFARTVGTIDPAWAEALAGDLVKRSYGEPRWEKRQGSAVADEKVTLYGVPIVPKRRIQLARIDAEQARELFIRHAMVDGDWPSAIERNGLFDFVRANAALRDELSEVEERMRRRDILVDDEVVFDFYDRRVPREVTDVRRFETWWKTARIEAPTLLTMSRDTLVEPVEALELDSALDLDAFPSEWVVSTGSTNEVRMPLRYRFEPGSDDDGVTLEVPLAVLPHLQDRGFDWLVPGLREELVTALIKTLPKAIRRNVVPAADWARRLLTEVSTSSTTEKPLTEFLAAEIRRLTHTVIAPTDFDPERLPAHLRMTFSAVDERGRRVASSTDLVALQHRLAEQSRQSVAKLTASGTGGPARPGPGIPPPALEREGLTSWDFDALPSTLETKISTGSITGYPALVDHGTSVAIRVFGTAAEQAREHARGVRRLIALTVPSPLSYVQEHLTATEKLQLATSPYRSTTALFDDALLATIDQLVDAASGDRAPVTRAAFESLRAEVNARLVDALFATVALAARILGAARDADRAISGGASLSVMAALADARAQLDALVHPGFLRITGVPQLRRLPLYLGGIVHRVAKLPDAAGRDRVWLTEVEQATALYLDAGGTLPLTADTPEHLVRVRWMLEELRISLFAQQLGTVGTVSLTRIRKALA